jgi:beta-xylosidase
VPPSLWAQRLSDDGLAVAGEPTELFGADRAWEGGVVEGPSMVGHDGHYYLFYSANAYDTEHYAIGYAVCETALGPCTKPESGPWLGSSEHAQGPGGVEVFRDEADDLWIVFHAWIAGEVGYPDGVRNLFASRLTFVDGVPVTEA